MQLTVIHTMSHVQIHICVSCIRSPLNASIYGINRHLGPIQCKTQRKRKKERKKTRKHPFDQESDQEKKKENTLSTKKAIKKKTRSRP